MTLHPPLSSKVEPANDKDDQGKANISASSSQHVSKESHAHAPQLDALVAAAVAQQKCTNKSKTKDESSKMCNGNPSKPTFVPVEKDVHKKASHPVTEDTVQQGNHEVGKEDLEKDIDSKVAASEGKQNIESSSSPDIAVVNHSYNSSKRDGGRTPKNNQRKYVTHDYEDYFNARIETEYERKVQEMSVVSVDRRKALDLKFIVKLHFELENIEEDQKSDVMGWMPHGRSFRIHDRERFIGEILPKYFGMNNGNTSCTSFMRQLHMYGFTRLTRISGPDQGSYYNELFLRGKAFLTCRIKRVKVNGKGYKHSANPSAEPCFYNKILYKECKAPVDHRAKGVATAYIGAANHPGMHGGLHDSAGRLGVNAATARLKDNGDTALYGIGPKAEGSNFFRQQELARLNSSVALQGRSPQQVGTTVRSHPAGSFSEINHSDRQKILNIPRGTNQFAMNNHQPASVVSLQHVPTSVGHAVDLHHHQALAVPRRGEPQLVLRPTLVYSDADGIPASSFVSRANPVPSFFSAPDHSLERRNPLTVVGGSSGLHAITYNTPGVRQTLLTPMALTSGATPSSSAILGHDASGSFAPGDQHLVLSANPNLRANNLTVLGTSNGHIIGAQSHITGQQAHPNIGSTANVASIRGHPTIRFNPNY